MGLRKHGTLFPLLLLACDLVLAGPGWGQVPPAPPVQPAVEPIVAALRAGQFSQAEQLARDAARQFPKNAQVWALLGISLSEQQKYKEALAAFHRSLGISGDYLPALEGAAQIQYQADSEEAVPLLQHILQLRPEEATAHAMLAVVDARKGQCDAAVEHFSHSGPLLDSQPDALREYGTCLVKLKQPDKAITVFKRDLALRPENAAGRRRLAAVQLDAGRANDALATLAPVLQAKTDAGGLELASAAYEALGKTPEAVSTLR